MAAPAIICQSAPKVEFLNRMASLPLVNSALGVATTGYGRIKSYNGLVAATLDRAESTIWYVAETAKPVIVKLEKPITIADTLACHGLAKLEEKVPAIKKSTEEIKDETVKLYSNGVTRYEEMKKLGSDKVQGLKSYGYNTVNSALVAPYLQAVIKSVDTAMDLTESAVNHYLPPAENEPQLDAQAKDRQNVVERMGYLSDKMRRRMYKQAMNQIDYIQKRSQETLQRMNYTVDLIQFAKSIEESGRQKVSHGVTVVSAQAKWVWDELNKETTPGSADAIKTLDQRLLDVARSLTRQAVSRYNQLSQVSHLVPENLQKSIEAGRHYATDVYSELSKASTLRDVSDLTLKQMVIAGDLMQKSVVSIFSNIMPSLTWIVPIPTQRNEANVVRK